VPFADVVIDTSCSACSLCARYCPTGALSFVTAASSADAPHSFTLSFRMSTCIDCGVCAAACPEDAVTFASTIDILRIHQPDQIELRSGTLTTCSSCTMPTAATAGTEPARCFSCRLGSGVVTALRDDAGLMADLLSRQQPNE
jgi:formate hydrogenlyase subunit 6/NADH:ubiquinone oxidoreductase subunit I